MRKASSQTSPKIPLIAAVYWIVGSVIVVMILGFALTRQILLQREKQKKDPKHWITKIIQTGPQKEALSTLYLTELMQLSKDHPFIRETFDVELAEKRLLSSPVIQKAKVFFDKPGTVVVDYAARRPQAWLYDFINVGVDANGVPFPVFPFFSPKKLPEIYLGEPLQLVWNQTINHPKMQLALSILEMLAPAPFTIKRIDVGCAYAESYGKRQIILIVEEQFKIQDQNREITCVLPRILRLSTKDYRQELGNYIVMRDELSLAFDPKLATFESEGKLARLPLQVIDLRISGMAFLK